MQTYYDLFQCWIQYHVGIILLLYYNCLIFFLFFFKCIYVDVCLENVNQYYKKKNAKSLSDIIAQGFYLCNGCPKSIKATLNKNLSYTMLSGASKTTQHKILTVQCSPRRYQCNVFREGPDNIASEKSSLMLF